MSVKEIMIMKPRISNILIGLGTLLILAALVLFAYNQQEAASADRAAKDQLSKLMMQMETSRRENDGKSHLDMVQHLTDPYTAVMDTLTVDGHEYIGYLTIPDLGIEMPIMSDWSMEKLRIAPCRYSGSVGGNDLVLMGHNYDRGFGQLPQIEVGSEIYFRDVNGIMTVYQVVAKDILAATSVEEMVSGEYDLTLFTCTYGGQNRLTIRCEKMS